MQIFAKVLNYINNLTQNNLFLNIATQKPQKSECIFIHPPSHVSILFYNVELISSIYPNTSSLPSAFSDDVTNTGGSSSHSSSRRALYAARFFARTPFVTLSALVKIIEKGTPFSPSHWKNSRSIFCGSWRQSMSTKSSVICSRSRM